MLWRDTAMERLVQRVLLSALAATIASAAPRLRVARDAGAALRLGLPSNATSIRASEMLSERFSCAGRHYGYYADPDNDCQLFHVCLPVQFDDGRGSMYKWSFVCPEDTIFNQETFTCSRREDAIPCQDSERFYNLNDDIGVSRRQQQQQEAEEAEAAEEGVADAEEAEMSVPHYGHLADRPDRPAEARPQLADTALLPQQTLQATTDPADEATSKYGAFTTIRY